MFNRSAALWALVLVFSGSACGDESTESNTENASTKDAATTSQDSGTGLTPGAEKDAEADKDAGAAPDTGTMATGADAGTDAGPVTSCTTLADGVACMSSGSAGICVKEKCKASRCGDGVLVAGEECDDGNMVDFDGCSPDCKAQAVCGNHKKEAGEECDDGNVTDLDGCSSTCKTACETCLASRLTRYYVGDSVDNLLTACSAAVGNASQGPAQGEAKAKLCVELLTCAHRTGCIYGDRPGLAENCYCGDATFQECFANPLKPNGECKHEFEAAAESTDVVTVGGHAAALEWASGAAMKVAEAEVHLCPNECAMECAGKADGTVCDQNNGTCASQLCVFNSCGDGVRDGTEECDYGIDSLCTTECLWTGKVCGDNIVYAAQEQCDDGNARDDNNGCSATCQKVGSCGDGIIQSLFETCDDHDGATPVDSRNGCSETCQRNDVCGDGKVQSLYEQCDYQVQGGPPCTRACRLI